MHVVPAAWSFPALLLLTEQPPGAMEIGEGCAQWFSCSGHLYLVYRSGRCCHAVPGLAQQRAIPGLSVGGLSGWVKGQPQHQH